MERTTELTPRQLRERRLALGWSPTQLAGVVGVSPRSVESWEAGESEIPNSRSVHLLLRGFERYQQRIPIARREK
jgi:transcriptional regulator with XRE-family HTH domain